jgi:2-haloacid dehalogenase
MLDFSRFRVITFDCYGTLIDWESGILGALRPILFAHHAQMDDSEILRLYGEFEAEAEAGEYRSYREVLRDVVTRFGRRLNFEPTSPEQDSLPESMKNWEPFADSIPALRQLKSALQVGIISNVDDDLFAATERKLQTDFDFVITAGQAGAYKPSLKIFELAQKKLDVNRSEWVHAGQSVYHDVIPAQSLGLATVWVNRSSLRPNIGAVRHGDAQPDATVTSLADLARLVAI